VANCSSAVVRRGQLQFRRGAPQPEWSTTQPRFDRDEWTDSLNH